MGQRAPSLAQIGVAVAFAFSCFGLLLFLWSAFGGPVPFAPQGYRVNVPFNEATQLAVESDVRISNVSVGRVKKIELEEEGENRDLAVATIEIDEDHAPIPEDTLAILRQKTLLGETYVELTPGNREGPKLPEDGTLPAAQVSEAVQLDEIFRTFDDRTRAAFQSWMQGAAVAFAGRGADVNAAIANLEPFAEDANDLLRVLDTQEQAVSQFVNNTGVVFEALSERQGQLRGLIENSGTVFATTAQRDEDLREAFRALPTFLDESRLTLQRLERFSADTNPLITQLRPAGRELSGVLRQVARVTPDFKGFFVGFRKLAKRSKTGLPALRRLLDDDLPPLLAQLQPFTQQLGPIVETARRYDSNITSLLGNATAILIGQGSAPETNNQPVNYLRTAAGVTPQGFAVFPTDRLTIDRPNAYTEPKGALKVGGGLDSFETRFCTPGPGVIADLVEGNIVGNADFDARAQGGQTPQVLFDNLQDFAFNGASTTGGGAVSAPPCTQQPAQSSIGQIAELSDYPHVYRYAP